MWTLNQEILAFHIWLKKNGANNENKKDERLMLFYTEDIQKNNTTWRASYSAHTLLRESVEQHKSPVILSAQQRDRRRAERHALLLNTHGVPCLHILYKRHHMSIIFDQRHWMWYNHCLLHDTAWNDEGWTFVLYIRVAALSNSASLCLEEPLQLKLSLLHLVFSVKLSYLWSTTIIKKLFKLLYFKPDHTEE